MPNPKQLVVVLVASVIVAGAGRCPREGGEEGGPRPASRFEKVVISGAEVKNGFFDASVEYGDDGVGWLAYSQVEVPKYVATHVARSTDGGQTWSHVSTVNPSGHDSIVHQGRKREGVWRSETPSLLYDRADAPERRWKLFSQRYFTLPPYKDKSRLFDTGWIEYRTAATPAGPWSEPVRLFGAEGSGSRVDLRALDAELRSMSYFNEIGSIAVSGVIYISLDASPTASGLFEWERRKIILVSSYDHGTSWSYCGTLTGYDEAVAFGYRAFTGSSLVREGERLFLLITPAGARKKKNKHHDGTYAIEFADISKATLKRDEQGKLHVESRFDIDLFSGGLSDYDEHNTYGGVLLAQIDINARPDVFQTFATRRRIVDR